MHKCKVNVCLGDFVDLLSYDKDTGIFRWKKDLRAVSAGDVAGCKDKDGYTVIFTGGKAFKAHRLAWLFVYGEMPSGTIDHINRVRDDNRICNLRIASIQQQAQNKNKHRNNRSGYPGIFWSMSKRKWQAQITYKNKRYHVGLFDDIKEAKRQRDIMKDAITKRR